MQVHLTFVLPGDVHADQLADILHVASEAGRRGRNWVDAVSWRVTFVDGSGKPRVLARDRG